MLSTKLIEKLDYFSVIEKYTNGMTLKEIALELNCSPESIRQYLLLKDIVIRKASKRKSLRHNAPKGQKFGLWTVVSDDVKSGNELGKTNGRTLFWLVQCECGNLAWKNSAQLKAGNSTRCKQCGNKNFITKEGNIDIEALIISKFTQVKDNLKTRKKVNKLEFSITPEYISKLYRKNHYCALSGIDLSLDLTKTLQQQNLSIDRINSNLGYIPDNIQLVDKRINMMKGTLSNEEFINLCCKIAEKHGYSKCG